MNEQRKNATTILYFLGDTLTSDFAYWDRCYRSVICLSVTFVHCVQTAEDIDTIFLHMTAPCLFQIALKFGLHRSTSFFPNFAPKWSTPVNLSVGDIRRQIAAEKVRLVRDSAMVRGIPSLLQTVPLVSDPVRHPLLQYGVPKDPNALKTNFATHADIWRIVFIFLLLFITDF